MTKPEASLPRAIFTQYNFNPETLPQLSSHKKFTNPPSFFLSGARGRAKKNLIPKNILRFRTRMTSRVPGKDPLPPVGAAAGLWGGLAVIPLVALPAGAGVGVRGGVPLAGRRAGGWR